MQFKRSPRLSMLLSLFVSATVCIKAGEFDYRKISGYGNHMAYFAACHKNYEAWKTNWDKSLAEQARVGDQLSFDEHRRFYGERTRISAHYDAERTRIADHFVRKGVHDDGAYTHLNKSLLAAPLAGGLLMDAWHCYDQCKNFKPRDMTEFSNAHTLKRQEMQKKQRKEHQDACVVASLVAKKSSAGAQKFPDNRQFRNNLISKGVADFLAGEPERGIQKNNVKLTNNDYPRYRRYKYTGIFCGVTGCIAAAFSLHQFGKFINYPQYPSFVPNEFVPNKV